MPKTLAALVIVVLLLAVVGGALFDAPAATDQPSPAASREGVDGPVEPDLVAASDPIVAAAVRSPAEAPAAELAKGEPRLAAESAARGAAFKGTVIVYDVDGKVVSTAVNGRLMASIGHVRTSTKVEIGLTSGAFELAVEQGGDGVWLHPDKPGKPMDSTAGAAPDDLVLEVSGGEADGLGALVLMESSSSPLAVRDQRVPLDPAGTELHLRTIPPFTLTVVDAKNRSVQLKDVEVLAARGQTDTLPLGEGSKREALASDEASPVTLLPGLRQGREKEVTCFIGAPGFAWKAVPLNLSGGGERTVALDPGGDLGVQVQGDAPREARLRVYPEGARMPVCDLPFENAKEHVLEGLGLGGVSVRIEVGLYFRTPIVLAEEEVLIQSGSRASVLLAPTVPEVPQSVEVSGELFLPVEWGMEEALVQVARTSPPTGSKDERSLLRLSQLKRDPARSGVYPFSLGKLVPGEYVATLSGVRQAWGFAVPAEGLTGLRLVLPPPVQVVVTVRDSMTGEISELAKSLHWEPKYDGFRKSSRYARVGRDEATKRFHLTVPAGPVSVGASHRQLARSNLTFDATDGIEVDLEVRRIPLARIGLQHDGRSIPWPDGFNFDRSCRRVDGEGRVLMRGGTKTGAHFTVSEPGRYQLTLPKIEGFKLHEPVEMELTVDEIHEVSVELRPES